MKRKVSRNILLSVMITLTATLIAASVVCYSRYVSTYRKTSSIPVLAQTTFDPNGGEGDPVVYTGLAGTEYVPDEPVSEFGVFLGWFENPDGTGSEYPGVIGKYSRTWYAAWMGGDATLLTGEDFNKKIKEIASGEAPESTDAEDAVIRRFAQSPDKPSAAVTGADLTYRIDDPELKGIPIYAWMDGSTMYYYTSSRSILSQDSTAEMFKACAALEYVELFDIDFTANTDADQMFYGDGALVTIKVDALTCLGSAASGDGMFGGCTSIVGGCGTVYDPANTGISYAVIDDPFGDAPGYLTGPQYTIHFDKNISAATGSMPDMHPQIGVATPLVRPEFEYVYWIPYAWAEKADEQAKYMPGDTILVSDVDEDYELTLYAIWDVVPALAPGQTWYKSETPVSDVTKVTILTEYGKTVAETVADNEELEYEEEWIANADGTREVRAYRNGTEVYIVGDGIVFEKLFPETSESYICTNVDSSRAFSGFSACEEYVGLDHLNTGYSTDMSYMFAGCDNVKRLDLSSFNTANVTNMVSMFQSCVVAKLSVIYVGDEWSTELVPEGTDVFPQYLGAIQGGSFDNLTGEAGTTWRSDKRTAVYACVDDPENGHPGYLTRKGHEFAMFAPANTWYKSSFNRGSITKVTIDPQYEPSGAEDEVWNADSVDLGLIKCYRIGAELMITYEGISAHTHTNASSMFSGFSSCEEYVGLDHLDTSYTTNMESMFAGCSSVSHLNLASFNTANVTNMVNMFQSYVVAKLSVIYVGDEWSTELVPEGTDVFPQYLGAIQGGSFDNLTGEAGTTWRSDKRTAVYACVDDPENGHPGYLTRCRIHEINYVLGDNEFADPKKDWSSFTNAEKFILPVKGDMKNVYGNFQGWYDNADYNGDPITELDHYDNDITLYAKNGYLIDYYATIPSGYTSVEYIESTGTQYIDVGVPMRSDYKYEIKFQYTTTGSTDEKVFGVDTGDDHSHFGKFKGQFRYELLSPKTTYLYQDTKEHVVQWGSDLTVDGVTSQTDASYNFSKNVWIFKANNSSPTNGCRIYYVKVWNEDGGLIRNMVPVKNPDGKAVFYDLVNDVEYANEGSGDFVTGNELDEYVIYEEYASYGFDYEVTAIDVPANKTLLGYATEEGGEIVYNVGDVIENVTSDVDLYTVIVANPTVTYHKLRKLPSGYTAVEYIESHGQEYIDTGVQIQNQNGDGLIVDFQIVSGSRESWVTGAATNACEAGIYEGRFYTDQGYVYTPYDPEQTSLDSRYTVSVQNYSSTQTKGNQLLFGKAANGNNMSGKIWSCQITKANKIVRDFVPCLDPDGNAGLYDLVGGQFYGNSGSGSFVAGAVASDVALIPYGSDYEVTAIDVPANKTLLGYATEEGGEIVYNVGDVIESVTSDIALYAVIVSSPSVRIHRSAIVFVEYLESTGTQWIDSGYLLSGKNFRAESTYQTLRYDGEQHIVATWNGGTNYQFGVSDASRSGKVTESLSTTGSSSRSLYIFAQNEGSAYHVRGSMRVYALKFYENDVLIRDFVPCIGPDGEPGLYDLVEGKFYGNSGSGSFTAGDRIELPVEYTSDTSYVPYGSDYEVTACDIIDGYTLLGYATEKDGALVYEAGDVIENVTSDVDLYTVVAANPTVTYHTLRKLPSGYTAVEYIESTGTQYIDVGVPMRSDYKYEIKFQYTTTGSTDEKVFGVDTGDHSHFGKFNGQFRYELLSPKTTYLYQDTKEHVVQWGSDLTVDGVTSQTDASYNFSRNVWIFKANDSSPTNGCRIYYVKVWNEDGGLIRNMVPVNNPDGKAVFYDLVNDVEYANEGSGDFVTGDDIELPVVYVTESDYASYGSDYEVAEISECTTWSDTEDGTPIYEAGDVIENVTEDLDLWEVSRPMTLMLNLNGGNLDGQESPIAYTTE